MSFHLTNNSDIASNMSEIIVIIDETIPYSDAHSDNNNRNKVKVGKSQCETCGQTFTEKRSCNAHIKEVHLNSKSFGCTICKVVKITVLLLF